MRQLFVLAVVGFLAQLVDGSLGMAYGATSTSLLLLAGIAPAVASASVHLSEVGTSFVSGVAHWRFGNVDWRVVVLLGVPGALGAFAGATVLSNLSTAAARPVTATILLLIGCNLLVRRHRARHVTQGRPLPPGFLAPLGLVAGFVDASGGGGWGPLSTPAMLMTGRIDARRVIGSVSTAEFLVTIAASVGFLLALGRAGFDGRVVVALLASGVVAAPTAAWLVRHLPVEALGASVGGLLVLTNAPPVLTVVGVTAGPARWTAYAGVVVAWVAAVVVGLRRRSTTDGDGPGEDEVYPRPLTTGTG